MIGFNHLGNMGRFGNQMFQFAAIRGIAAKHKYDFCIPSYDNIEIANYVHNYCLHLCFKLNHIKTGIIDTEKYISEKHFHLDEDLFENCQDNISLVGFFQSEKYFKHISDVIRSDFTFHESIIDPCREFVSKLKNPIMLHVRRGDPNLIDRGFKWSYTQCGDQHPVQSIEYYEKALAQFDDKQPVIVFSDSPEWVKEQEFFSGDRFLVSEPKDKYADGSYTPYVDLCLMSLCSHAIIANSSLSWWGAWLISNPNKKVIAPNKWFGPTYSHHNTKDLYCSDWVIL